MTSADGAGSSARRKITLLAGQAFTLGLMMSWLLVGASTIFLDTYGSGLLPVTYVGAALAGVASSAALTAAFRTKSLVTVARQALIGLSVVLAGSWLLLWLAGADWVSFALLVVIPIMIPVGFMFLVGQAGMLLDVRALKALYARVIAGFALGFVTGGLAGPLLLEVLGRTEHLLATAAAAAGLWLLLLGVTRRQFGAELSQADDVDTSVARPTIGELLRDRYVRLIVAFQMLSALESQWLDYLVLDRATQRYDDSRDLAEFIGRFTAIAYGADILFLLLAAGALLRRFGLRYGLTANPAGVLTLLALMAVASSIQGSAATVVFVTVVGARVTDLVLSDGASRSSLSAAYQVVPTSMRLAAQATVEGLAVPLAIGASGVVLLLLRATAGTDGMVLPTLTSLVVVTWVVVATLVHRGYRVSLLASLRYRTLDPATLSIDDANSLPLIDRLIESDDWRDVRLGLDTLTAAQHPELSDRLHRLATQDDRVPARIDALARLLGVDRVLAASAARAGLDHHDAEVRAASVRALGEVQEPGDLDLVVAKQVDLDPLVQVAVAAAMARIGDDAVRSRVAGEIARRSRSTDPDQRASAARMLADCPSGPGLERAPLRDLLADDEDLVARAALDAVRWPDDAGALDQVLGRLAGRRTAAAALAALVRGGAPVLEAVDARLVDPAVDRRTRELLVRVCRAIGGPAAAAVLRRHADHPDREVGLWAMESLGAMVPTAGLGVPPAGGGDVAIDLSTSTGVADDVRHAVDVLAVLHALQGLPSAALLATAMQDELGLLQRRVLAALSVRHGDDALSRVAFQLAQDDTRVHALALEWLDVTLAGADRSAVPLLEPGLSDAERLRALLGRRPLPPSDVTAVLRDLVVDAEGRWRQPWVQACALLAAHGLPDGGRSILATVDDSDASMPVGGDETIHGDTLAAIRRRLDRAEAVAGGSVAIAEARGPLVLEDDLS